MRDNLIDNLLRRLLDVAERDVALRSDLRAVAEAVLADLDAIEKRGAAPTVAASPATATAAPAGVPAPARTPAADAPAVPPAVARPPSPAAPRVQTPLRIGDE